MAVFDKGNKDIVLRHLGLSYGFIYTERMEPVMVIDIETGRHILRERADHGAISYRDIDKVERQMRRARIPENGETVRQKLQRRPRPYTPSTHLTFKVCPGCGMHGRLLDSWDKDLSSEILSLMDGISACQNLFMKPGVMSDKLKLDSVLCTIKQMAESPCLPYKAMIEGRGCMADFDDLMFLDDCMPMLDMEPSSSRGASIAGTNPPGLAQALMRAMKRPGDPRFNGR